MHATSYTMANSIASACKADGKKVVHLHGHNNEIEGSEEEGDQRTHAQYKREVIEGDMDQGWDCLIYTASVTAGLDIQAPVDLTIGVYSRRTADPFAFVQGLLRARQTKKMHVILPIGADGDRCTPNDLTAPSHRAVYATISEQLRTFATARLETMRRNAHTTIPKQLVSLGFEPKIIDLDKAKAQPLTREEREAVQFVPLTEAEVKTVDAIGKGEVTDVDTIVANKNAIALVHTLRAAGFSGAETTVHQKYDELRAMFGGETTL